MSHASLTPRDVSSVVTSLYTIGSPFFRFTQRLRPFICPFHSLIEHIPVNARVLDVGCGAGLFLMLLAEQGRNRPGVGFDANARAIETARQVSARLPAATRPEFLHRTTEQNWPEGQFDVVSLIDVLHHVPPAAQRSVIEKAADSVRPGGLLLYKDMALKPRWMAAANRLHDLVLAREWIHYAPISEVDLWAQQAQMTKRHEEDFSMYWYRHELRLFEK